MREAPGVGSLEGEGVLRGEASHPVCGDEFAVDLRVEDGVVTEYRWRASGCPATTAVPAAVAAAWQGCPVDELQRRLDQRLAELGGLAAHERHTSRALMRAVRQALDGSS